MRLARLLLPLLLAATPALAHPPLALHAREVHLGDGRVLAPGVVLVHGDRIEAVGAEGEVAIPPGADLRRVGAVLPGLVALHAPRAGPDPRSVAPDRRALDLVDRLADRSHWLEAGITAVAISPGEDRLVSGRGGVLRLAEGLAERDHLLDGPVHAVLRESAFSPPAIFEPRTPVNVDNPLEPARRQRPDSPVSAVNELRAALGPPAAPGFEGVASGATLLAIHADTEEEIDAALELLQGSSIRAVLVGGTEAWKRAGRLAEAGVAVLLTGPSTEFGPPEDSRGDWRPDSAARLSAAGVSVALGVEAGDGRPAPLLAAAAAVRAGLSEAEALAAITGRAAAAAGAPSLGRLRAGGPADLVATDGPPLSLHSEPVLVLVGGRARFEREGELEPDVLVLRAGALRTATRTVRDVSLVLADGRVRGIETGTALSGGAEVRDYGARAVIVPGSLDAFTWIGIEEGPPASGGSRVRASEALELDHPSLRRALAAGVTSALAVPGTSGPFRGRAELVSTALLPADPEAKRSRPELEVLAPESAPFVFWLDEGPGDTGARSGRVRALQGLLRKAKAYHDQWTAFEKKDDGAKKNGAGKKKAAADKKRVHLQDARNRPGRDDEGEARAPSARKGAGGDEKKKKKPDSDPELEPWRALFRGQAPAWLRTGRHDSIEAGLDAFKSVGLKPVLVGGEEADVVAERLARDEIPVVLRPALTRRDEGGLVLVARALRAAGVKVAFGSVSAGGADRLPLQAAAAVRAGLSPSDALRALTLDAAAVTKAPDGLGRLDEGDRADCVVYSGDPLEPASRVLAVVVRGRLVHEWGDDPSGLGQ